MRLDDVTKNTHKISIDTRTIRSGDIFLAIKGKRFDGHDFVEGAFKKGAKSAIVSKEPKHLSSIYKDRLIKVKDTTTALGDIARLHRLKFDIPIVAITGSNGKTTAKDIVAYVLASRYNVLRNETSKNNLIGLPLTLLGLKKKHDVAVLEMGMNRLGEITKLVEIAKPHIGVITNIGPSHLEFLGSVKNVFIAKSELLNGLSKKDIAILNKDDIYLRNIKRLNVRKIYFGIEKKCQFQAEDPVYVKNRWHFSLGINSTPGVESFPLRGWNKGKTQQFELQLLGRHNIYNALIAIVVAYQFGIDFSTIRERIKSYRQTCLMRLEFKNICGIEFLDDSYNSNPQSLEYAISTLAEYQTSGKRIVVSGDMLELGKKAKVMHQAIGKLIASSPIDALITLGTLSNVMNKEARRRGMNILYHAKLHEDAAVFLKRLTRPGDVVLVKGSRAMEMEKVIELFKRQVTNVKL